MHVVDPHGKAIFLNRYFVQYLRCHVKIRFIFFVMHYNFFFSQIVPTFTNIQSRSSIVITVKKEIFSHMMSLKIRRRILIEEI